MSKQTEMFPEMPKSPSRPYLGCDPGKLGGLCLLLEDGQIFTVCMPTIGQTGKEEIDERELANFMLKVKVNYPNALAVIEDVHSIFGSSASSNFTFGYNCGLLKGAIVAAGLSYTMIQPKIWQKTVWINSDKVYKSTKTKTGREQLDTKGTSALCARRLAPDIDFRKTTRSQKAHDGKADAFLIATAAKILNL